MKQECCNCRYKKRGSMRKPCITGVYQLLYSHRCYLWKKRTWWQRILDKIKNALIVYKDKALRVKVILDYERNVSDAFGDFKFYLKISKVYTLLGVVYRLEVPNRFDHDKSLWQLLARGFQYIHDKGCRYTRLEDELVTLGIWRRLGR